MASGLIGMRMVRYGQRNITKMASKMASGLIGKRMIRRYG